MSFGTITLSPLVGIDDVEALGRLSYFDSLAILGELSLHSGGIQSTGELFELAQIYGNAEILEIGCGTGVTTHAMLQAGYKVTVLERCERMCRAMVRNCLMHTGRIPKYYNKSAENMELVESNFFDAIIMEAVFGFITDKSRAVSEMIRVLKPGGVIAVTDFHYVSRPSRDLEIRLANEFNIYETMERSNWEDYFKNMDLVTWKPFDLGFQKSHGDWCSEENIKKYLTYAKLLEKLPGGNDGVSILSKRLTECEKVFAENRTHMVGHQAVWKKNWISLQNF